MLHDVADQMYGSNRDIHWMVERGIELFLELEAPVYIAEAEETRRKLTLRSKSPEGHVVPAAEERAS